MTSDEEHDRDLEKQMRKDSDDLVTDLLQALRAVMANSQDTKIATAVLKRIRATTQEGSAAK